MPVTRWHGEYRETGRSSTRRHASRYITLRSITSARQLALRRSTSAKISVQKKNDLCQNHDLLFHLRVIPSLRKYILTSQQKMHQHERLRVPSPFQKAELYLSLFSTSGFAQALDSRGIPPHQPLRIRNQIAQFSSDSSREI